MEKSLRPTSGAEDAFMLNGVSAPELKEPLGSQSKQFMRKLVLGETVRCELDGTKTYDRFVGICYLDSVDIDPIDRFVMLLIGKKSNAEKMNKAWKESKRQARECSLEELTAKFSSMCDLGEADSRLAAKQFLKMYSYPPL